MIKKSTINMIDSLFPLHTLKFYTIDKAIESTDILKEYAYAYLKQPVTNLSNLYIIVFNNNDDNEHFKVKLFSNKIPYIEKNLTTRAKQLFNVHLNEYLESYNVNL